MKVGIDAFALSQPFNGIGQVTTHFLNTLQALSQAAQSEAARNSSAFDFALTDFKTAFGRDCQFYLYMAEDPDCVVPKNFHKRVLPQKMAHRTLSKKWWETRQLPAAVRRDKCDLLISLYQSAAVMPKNFPHVMVVHDIIYALFPHFVETLGKRISLRLTLRGIRRASHCIAVSNYTKEDMIRHVGMSDEKISVAHIAADPQFAQLLTDEQSLRVLQKYRLDSGYIYHGGGFDARKNLKGVMEAYAILLKQSADGNVPVSIPNLVISGDLAAGATHPKVAEDIAKKLGILDRVIFLGRVPQSDLPALYRGASVFLFPSRYEGFGLPILEAMHQGVPVVAANTTSLPEVGGDAVLYCDPEKPEEIAAATARVLTNAATREMFHKRGLQRATDFTWESFMQNFLKTVVRVLKKQKA